MKKPTDQPQETQSAAKKHIINQDKSKTHNKKLLRRKAGYSQHTSPQSALRLLFELYIVPLYKGGIVFSKR